MADEEKNEQTEEETTVPEAETPEPASPEANQVPESEPETPDPVSPEASQVPEPEPETEAAPEVPAKPSKSRRHVPRAARRTRTKTVREKPATRKPITRTSAPEPELGRHQERRGVVVSDKGEKTIVVKVDMIRAHPKYKKVVRRSRKFHAHDEQNAAGIGDVVRIVESRRLSKTKIWRLAEIVEKAK
jgi:small subunit ribosomal protein S17